MIDLRSDTVTQPTQAMREAMRQAEVGDDYYHEDPTIRRLEELSAERMGMAAGLFVASGTMGNLVSLLTHCRRGDETILGDVAHTYLFESGGLSALGGIHPRPIPTQADGTLHSLDIERAVRPDSVQEPRSRLLCVENTHNRCCGVAVSPQQMDVMTQTARLHGLAVHLDGARIFNAAIGLEVAPRDLTRGVDSVTFCLSKGLAAPAGAMLCGKEDFVREARRIRQMVGGGMRQVGVLGAAGIIALEQMVERLREDHENARWLADGIANIAGLRLVNEKVQTNIVVFELLASGKKPVDLHGSLARQGIRVAHYSGTNRFRAVTHWGISRNDINAVRTVLSDILTRGNV
jgi:threonine aldolase